ncbi:hypothetical protein [Corynebacterium epidermidicanis]|uniref:Transmembrane protein n=1 Tax=Corynebacterium epidermidicanis TaxID=1050174 RepID=A0A0G3GSE4_9CORY|nr:hypothetical protein [Corynebacterium epidermidicanis]AKK04054.1 hypothetical protein CEPID_11125 [Corynebacterium epidermidicanis]
MSDQQLTVAELMARAAKEGGRSSDAPRRRRRRSLEEGGVSVAEFTGSIPKVTAKPIEARHTAVPIDAPTRTDIAAQQPAKPAAVEPQTPAKNEVQAEVVATQPEAAPVVEAQPDALPTGVPISVVDESDPVRLTTDSFPAQSAATLDAPAPAKQKSAQDAEETTVLPVVEPSEAQQVAPVITSSEEVVVEPVSDSSVRDVVATDVVEELEEAEDDKISLVSVVVMALVGVAVGVGLFIGFKVLWASVAPLLVAALAIAMTLGLVGVVHALRTEKDGLSMVLAGLTGLAVTFGPMLVAQL